MATREIEGAATLYPTITPPISLLHLHILLYLHLCLFRRAPASQVRRRGGGASHEVHTSPFCGAARTGWPELPVAGLSQRTQNELCFFFFFVDWAAGSLAAGIVVVGNWDFCCCFPAMILGEEEVRSENTSTLGCTVRDHACSHVLQTFNRFAVISNGA